MKHLLATLGQLIANQRDLLLSALSVDAKAGEWAKVARQLGVHASTAFRWRHRFLALPRELRADSVGGIVEVDAVMCTDGSELMATAAKRLGLQHEALNLVVGQRVRGPCHIQNVNAHHAKLKQWLRRFNGVATSYLANYTGWFRAPDANSKCGLKPDRLLAMAVGA